MSNTDPVTPPPPQKNEKKEEKNELYNRFLPQQPCTRPSEYRLADEMQFLYSTVLIEIYISIGLNNS